MFEVGRREAPEGGGGLADEDSALDAERQAAQFVLVPVLKVPVGLPIDVDAAGELDELAGVEPLALRGCKPPSKNEMIPQLHDSHCHTGWGILPLELALGLGDEQKPAFVSKSGV